MDWGVGGSLVASLPFCEFETFAPSDGLRVSGGDDERGTRTSTGAHCHDTRTE
jgi:hypothetical protein